MTPQNLFEVADRLRDAGVAYWSSKPETIPPYDAWKQALVTLEGGRLDAYTYDRFSRYFRSGRSCDSAALLVVHGLASEEELIAIATLLFGGRHRGDDW